MLSERDRRTLARIERHLRATDPALARFLARHGRSASMHDAGPGAMMLLGVGLVVMVVGATLAVLPVAVLGITATLVALLVGWGRTAGPSAFPA